MAHNKECPAYSRVSAWGMQLPSLSRLHLEQCDGAGVVEERLALEHRHQLRTNASCIGDHHSCELEWEMPC